LWITGFPALPLDEKVPVFLLKMLVTEHMHPHDVNENIANLKVFI